jgi:hypothetical protein
MSNATSEPVETVRLVSRRWVPWAAAGLVVSALFWIDPLFIPLALLGPIVVGALGGWRWVELRFVALIWVVAGIGAVVSDYVVNREDAVFHFVLTALMLALAAAAWWIARALARRRAAPAV